MTKVNRLLSIDQFRGFAIFTMVLANYLAGVGWVPAVLKHAPDIGLTVIDLIAPFFIFAIGLTYGLSYRRRVVVDGWKATVAHFTRRYLALIGIGAILTYGEWLVGLSERGGQWGVLQAIGVAGLLALPALLLKPWPRIAAGLGLLAVYQVLLDHFWVATVLNSSHGGLPGTLGWAGMLIMATALGELFLEGKRWVMPVLGAGSLALGLLDAFVWGPISKNRVSSSYVLVSLGISALLYTLFYLFNDRAKIEVPLLSLWGKNPLVMYLLHELLLGLVALPDLPGWYNQAPLWLVVLQAVALMASLSAAGAWLQKRGWVLSM